MPCESFNIIRDMLLTIGVKHFIRMWTKLNLIHLLLLFCYCTVYVEGDTRDDEQQITPHFIKQPPAHIFFLNSSGAVIDCEVSGQPKPKITWIVNRDPSTPAHDVTGLRQTLANGSLWLQPMSPELYTQEVHSASVNCLAENEIFAILSHDIQIIAVFEQQYDIQVYDEFVLMGNTAVLRCHIPSFLKEHLSVIGWIRSLENSNYTSKKHFRTKNGLLIKKSNKNNHHNNDYEQHIHSDIVLKGRYSIFKTGELHIRNVTLADSTSGYRCLMHNQLTEQRKLSSAGRLIVTESSGTVPPRITHTPPLHIYARVGQQFELPCASQAYPLPSYTWSGPLLNETINEELRQLSLNLSFHHNKSEHNSTFLRPIQQSGSLYFDNLQIYHEGFYECTVRNTAGVEKVQLNLHVIEPLKVTIEPNISKNQLGDQVEFRCSFQGRPKANLSFYKNGRKLEPNHRFEILYDLSIESVKLIIHDIQRQDAGLYQCFGYNEFGSEQVVTRLELGHSPPIFHSKFETVNVEFDTNQQTVLLKCEASGNPLPRFQWLLDNQPLFSSSHTIDKNLVKLSERVDTSPPVTRLVSELKILIKKSKQSTSLGGVYKCVAKNLLAKIEHFARLNIPGELSIREMPSQKLISGMSLNLQCPYYGYPLDSIQWFKDSTKLPVNRRQSVYSNGTLIVHNAQKGTDDGQYVCMVHQAQKNRSQSVVVVIKKGPVLDSFNFPRNLELHMRARLVCTIISGDPPFTIQWLYDGEPILASTSSKNLRLTSENDEKRPEGKQLDGISMKIDGISMKIDEFSADLSFASVTEHHNGNYSCKVSNDVASTEHSTQLRVNVPPYWRIEPIDVSVLVGMRARLDCLANGYPKPSITWERTAISDGNQVNQIGGGSNQLNSQFVGIRTSDNTKYQLLPNGSLLMNLVQKTDAGLFFCSANNGIGPGLSRMVSLAVHSAPQFNIDSPSVFSVRIREPITFDCVVEGDKPIRSWWKIKSAKEDGFLIENQESTNSNRTNNSRIQIVPKLRKLSSDDKWSVGSLSIQSASPQDTGYFICTVQNEYGSADWTIKLIVQEPPHKPTEVQLLENGSRTARLSWKTEFNGNSEISKYWIFCHLQHFKGNDSGVNASVVSFDGNLNSATVHGLRPAQAYFCSVRAENEIGLSESSDHVQVFTKEEAPENSVFNLEAEAMDSSSIKVKWQAPSEHTHNGQLKGYYIGYRKLSNDQVLYKTLELNENQKPVRTTDEQSVASDSLGNNPLSIILTNLKPFTEYLITVQAFNSIGSGPASSPISIRTLEDVPNESPKQARCFSQSSQSLLISWRVIDEYSLNGILMGYRLRLRPLGADFNSIIVSNVSSSDTEQIIGSLNKFTNYSVQVFAYNSKGESPGSKPIYCRTMEDVPGAPPTVRALITGPDGALVTWLDPEQPNGLIIKFTVYWREFRNNRTKTSITIPRSIRTNSNLMTSNLQSASGSFSIGAKYFYLLKNGMRKKYRRLPDYNNNNQYKLSALKENVEYQLWITASNRRGEGSPSQLIFFKPSRITEPKIFEFSQSIPFRPSSLSTSSVSSNFSNSLISGDQSINSGSTLVLGQSLPVLLTCTVFSTERVQRKWTSSKSSAESNESLILDHEPDGSLLINDFNLDQLPLNFSCTVSNSIGSDQVVYHLFKEDHQKYAISVQVLSTTYNTAQIVFSTTIQTDQLDNKDYEVHYRNVNNEYINSLNAEYGEWNILPIFLPPIMSGQQQRNQMLGNQSESLQITDLECGALYEVFVKQPLNGWKSELIAFRTAGQAPLTPRKIDILQLVNRTLYIQLNAWFVRNPRPTTLQIPTRSLPLIYKRTNNLIQYDQSSEEFGQVQQHKDQQQKIVDGCPINRFVTEYRTSNTGLFKLLNVQQADSADLQPIELNMLNEKVIYTIRIIAYTVGRPFTVAEYDVRLNEQGIADYDEFLDSEDSIAPLNNMNSRSMILDQHTMFSIICSTLILLVLGCVLLLLILQRRRGLLLRGSNALPDKNSLYRKVINNGGDTSASASLLQSTIAYNNNRSVAASIRQQQSINALSSSNVLTNTADSTYVAQTAALQAVTLAFNGNYSGSGTIGSPRLGNYNQCTGKLVNSNINKLSGTNNPPDLPAIPPPLSSARRSNQVNVYKQSTLVANHRNQATVAAVSKQQEEEITPYATFTMSEEDVLERDEQNLLNSGDQLPPNIQELHKMHRQLSKLKQQQHQSTKSSQQQLISASVVDLFKPQQFIKQQIDKMGISRSRTAVESDVPTKQNALRKNNNLIYGGDHAMSSMEKKLLDAEESDLRMFSLKITNPDYMFRYCMDSNQMIGNNQMIDVEEQTNNILTPPASYLNTIDRNDQQSNYITNMLNNKKFNSKQQHQSDLIVNVTDSGERDTCSALYEFSCVFNKANYNESNQTQCSVAHENDATMQMKSNQLNWSSKNSKNVIRLIGSSGSGIDNYENKSALIIGMNKNMINTIDDGEAEMSDAESKSGSNSIEIESSSDDDGHESDKSRTSSISHQNEITRNDKDETTENCDGFSSSSQIRVSHENDDDVRNVIDASLSTNDSKFNNSFKSNKQSNKISNQTSKPSNLESQMIDHNYSNKAASRIARSRKPQKSSWTDMQTMLITADQKSERSSMNRTEDDRFKQQTRHKLNEMMNKFSDEKANQKNRIKPFKNSINQDLISKKEIKGNNTNFNRPPIRTKSKSDEVEC